jgi:hypothetical protein
MQAIGEALERAFSYVDRCGGDSVLAHLVSDRPDIYPLRKLLSPRADKRANTLNFMITPFMGIGECMDGAAHTRCYLTDIEVELSVSYNQLVTDRTAYARTSLSGWHEDGTEVAYQSDYFRADIEVFPTVFEERSYFMGGEANTPTAWAPTVESGLVMLILHELANIESYVSRFAVVVDMPLIEDGPEAADALASSIARCVAGVKPLGYGGIRFLSAPPGAVLTRENRLQAGSAHSSSSVRSAHETLLRLTAQHCLATDPSGRTCPKMSQGADKR